MKTMHFRTVIEADRGTVWDVMLAPDTFGQWTAAFAEGSHFEGSWQKGAPIRFLTPTGEGMRSEIAENRPAEFLSIRHLGAIKEGVDDPESETGRLWSSALENYTLKDAGGSTELEVAADVPPEYEQYMADTWPKALAKLKEICERRAGGKG